MHLLLSSSCLSISVSSAASSISLSKSSGFNNTEVAWNFRSRLELRADVSIFLLALSEFWVANRPYCLSRVSDTPILFQINFSTITTVSVNWIRTRSKVKSLLNLLNIAIYLCSVCTCSWREVILSLWTGVAADWNRSTAQMAVLLRSSQ